MVDGHSDDKTIDKIKPISTKLPQFHLLSTSKRNVSFQRNLGGRAAIGKYIIFMDADNRLPKFFIEGISYRLNSQNTDVFTTWCEPDRNTATAKAIASLFNFGIEAGKLTDVPYAQGAMIGLSSQKFRQTTGFDENITFTEDAEYIRRCYRHGFTFSIFKDPRYRISLRRFRRQGTIRSIGQYARLHLKSLTGKAIDQTSEYPMGGAIFKKNENSFLNITKNIIDSTTNNPGGFKKIQKIIKNSFEN